MATCLTREIFRIACLRDKHVTPVFLKMLANKFGGSSGDNINKDTGSEENIKKEKADHKSETPSCTSSPKETNPPSPTMYECRKYGHLLPSNDSMPCFDPLPNAPTGVFRCTAGEVLGPGAHKCWCYPCPEYFAYHHMTFYDMHLILRPFRQPSPKTGRKP